MTKRLLSNNDFFIKSAGDTGAHNRKSAAEVKRFLSVPIAIYAVENLGQVGIGA